MEKRNFIFIDHKGIVKCKTHHDSSFIQSSPKPGDEVYDLTNSNTSNPISGLVQRIQFDYISDCVNIYVKID